MSILPFFRNLTIPPLVSWSQNQSAFLFFFWKMARKTCTVEGCKKASPLKCSFEVCYKHCYPEQKRTSTPCASHNKPLMAYIPPEAEASGDGDDDAKEEEPLSRSPPLDNLSAIIAELSKDLKTLSARVDVTLPQPQSAMEAQAKAALSRQQESKSHAVELLLDALKDPAPAVPQVHTTPSTTTPLDFIDVTEETGVVPAPVSSRVLEILPPAYGHTRFHTAERFASVGGSEAWVRMHHWNLPRNRNEAEVWAFQWDHLVGDVAKEVASRRLLSLVAADKSGKWETANLLLRGDDELATPTTLMTMVKNANAFNKYKAKRDGSADRNGNRNRGRRGGRSRDYRQRGRGRPAADS